MYQKFITWGRALAGWGGIHVSYWFQLNFEYMFDNYFGKQILGAKIQNLKGKSPHFKLRFLNIIHGLSFNL